MTRTLNADQFKEMFNEVTQKIQDNREKLCEIDSAIGDGDHGTSLAKGFSASKDRLELDESRNIGDILRKIGMSLTEKIGGATGPLFATIFISAGKAAEGKEEVDLSLLIKMFVKATTDVQKRGGAKPGDKTMIDALKPAVEGLKEAKEDNLDLQEGLKIAHKRAKEGVKATKDMKPKKGRAKYLGERSLGHQDPGATSIALIFEAMSEYVDEHTKNNP